MMRTKLYNLIAWTACMMMASCTNQEIIEQEIKPVHSNTLNVMTEKQDSRSVLSYEGTFYWTENDYIGVYGEETENARFHFTSQTDGVSVFTGNMNASGETVKWAYFPYSEEVDVDEKQLSFPMPAERTISNENHSPMIGRIEANNTVRFYHTGGILLLKIVGLPKQASQLVITSEGENSPCLAGTAVIDDTNVDGCTYRIENGSKEVVYDVRNLEGDGYVYSIYMPLQIGTYEKVKVTLKNEVGGVIKERSLSNLVVARGKMTETPTLNFSDKMYAYEFVDDETLTPDWEKALLFSNDFFMAYRTTPTDGREYFFIDTFDLKNICRVIFDKEDNIIEIDIDNDIYYLYNYTENTFDLKVIWNYAEHEEFRGVERKNVKTRSMVYQPNDPHAIKCMELIGLMPSDPKDELEGEVKDRVKDKIVDGIYEIADSKGISNLDLWGKALDIQLDNAKTLASTLYLRFSNSLEKLDIGDITITPLKPQLSPDGKSIIVGYDLTGVDSNIPSQSQMLERGMLIKELDGNALTFSNSKKILDYKTGDNEALINGRYTYNYPCEPGKTYVMQAYLLKHKGNVFNPYFNNRLEIITIPVCYFKRIEIEPCSFSNGVYNFVISTSGYSNDNTYNYILNLYRNSSLSRTHSWNINGDKSYLTLYAREMDYETRQAKGKWEIDCSIDGSNVSYDRKTIILKYDRNPYIDLDVQIIDGPRKVGGSRAADDEEEKYYVQYKVTAKTKGSGWISQVRILEDGQPIKAFPSPMNEGESFTHIGKKTYKNKSELPTISCEGILINGAGNIQSSPGSISVASQVP